MNDLRDRYEKKESDIFQELQAHISLGGRISLTTDAWAGNNKLDYVAVTGHLIQQNGTGKVLLLDIIELTNPVHNGKYLAEKLLEVTNRLSITCSILAITRDNASPNNVMLDYFQTAVADQWNLMEEKEKIKIIKFDRKDGDVRCCAHIYNLAVQASKIRRSQTWSKSYQLNL